MWNNFYPLNIHTVNVRNLFNISHFQGKKFIIWLSTNLFNKNTD